MDDAELRIEPSSKNSEWVENCVVVPEDFTSEWTEIAHIAVQNGAFVDNSEEEAGDDQYCVRFPGSKEELLTSDGLRSRIRVLLSL